MSRSARDRLDHVSNCCCQIAFSRAIEAPDRGAPSPSSPRSASSKSPCASPCRYSSGSSCATSFVRRLKNGRIRLSNRSSRPRMRGRCTVSVPIIVETFRGLPNPLRYTGGSSAIRRSYRGRASSSSASSISMRCSSSCMRSRRCDSIPSHTALDGGVPASIFPGMAVAPFVRALGPWLIASTERCHRLQLISTPFEDTSRAAGHAAPRQAACRDPRQGRFAGRADKASGGAHARSRDDDTLGLPLRVPPFAAFPRVLGTGLGRA